MQEKELEIERLASQQRGRFTRRQVHEVIGNGQVARNLIERRLRSGRWRRLTSRVLKLPGAPDGWVEDLWTAHLHLGADSVVSHMAAARMWNLPAVPAGGPEIIVPAGSNRRLDGCVVHQRADLRDADVVQSSGLRVTSVPRTLADLSPHVSGPRMASLLDHAILERLATAEELDAQLAHLRRRGKATSTFRGALARVLPGAAVATTVLERELGFVLGLARLSQGVAQYPAPGRAGDRQGLVDRAWPEVRWIVEADGRRWHAREAAMAIDRARDRSAQAAGWLVTRVMHADLVGSPVETADELAAVHAQRVRDTARRDAFARDAPDS